MSNWKSKAKDIFNGYNIEPTKISRDYPSVLPNEIKIGNSKGYYYGILIITLILIWFALNPNNPKDSIQELAKSHLWLAILVGCFLTWSFLLMVYRIFFDKKSKLVIDKDGIRANNLTDKVDLTWKEIDTTSLYIGGKNCEIHITTKYLDEHKIFINNLEKTPKEIGHYIELFRMHYSNGQ